MTSWEVADVQWSPHVSKAGWVISTSNQKALIWNLQRPSNDAIEHVLHGHSRAITDINFHPENPELLATCSVDTSVLVWDTRIPKVPTYRVADWRAGASQVKWNFQNPNILASSHDHYFYLWDIRANKPLHKVNGHNRKVNGVDFSRTKENEIITCSNDNTVKYWDLSKDMEKPITTIHTDFPVWRARHLPFGNGCSIMPLRGGNNSVYLVNHKDETGDINLKPCYTFRGHSDRVTDFLWRCRYHHDSTFDDREFQLVTWSKDCDLRLWSMNENVYEKLDFKRGESLHLPLIDYRTYSNEPGIKDKSQLSMKRTKDTFVSSRRDKSNYNKTKDHLNWISGVRIGRSAFAPPIDSNLINKNLDNTALDNLGEEVSVVGHKFPKVRFEKISVSTGILILALNGPWSQDPEQLLFLRVEIKYPKEYPIEPPTFRIEENNELDKDKKQEIITNLNEISRAYAKYEKFSLEVCLRYLMGEKIDLSSLDRDDLMKIDDFEEYSLSSLSSGDDDDDDFNDDDDDEEEEEELIPLTANDGIKPMNFDSTPLPKGCGAYWGRSGQLVCFFIPKQDNKVNTKVIKFDQKGFSNQILFDDKDEASDDSLSDDWNDILKNDITSRSKIPGVFRIQNYTSGHSLNNNNFNSSLSNNNLNKKIESLPTERSAGTQKTNSTNKNLIRIIDFSYLIPSKKELASEYKIFGDSAENLAMHNSQVCLKYGYKELSNSWMILSSIFSKKFYWGTHPFGGNWFIKELMNYYEKLGNIQMLAMLSCVIVSDRYSIFDQQIKSEFKVNHQLKSGSFLVDVPSVKSFHRASSASSNDRSTLNGGYSDSSYRLPFSRSSSVLAVQSDKKNYQIEITMMNEVELGYGEDQFKVSLFEDDERYLCYREQYADMLYDWDLPLSRIEILKFNYQTPTAAFDIHKNDFTWNRNCSKDCNYCGLKVERRLFVCIKCEHILHAQCAEEWWKESQECPTGCGCRCLEESS